MKLFLCSHFSSVGSLIKEEIENKRVAFIPTASLREGYTGYVGSARKLFKKLGAIVTEIDISTEAYSTIQSLFEDADVIYFTGGNSFFLIDQLRKTGTDELLKKELAKGKLMIGESAGAIVCAPSIQYIEQMDEKPEDYSQEDDAGLDLIDFYIVLHYLTAPFKKATEKIMTEFSDLNLCPINNRQGIVIDGEGSKDICKDYFDNSSLLYSFLAGFGAGKPQQEAVPKGQEWELRTISWTVTRPFPARSGTRPACGHRAHRCASPYCIGRSSPRAPR